MIIIYLTLKINSNWVEKVAIAMNADEIAIKKYKLFTYSVLYQYKLSLKDKEVFTQIINYHRLKKK